VREDVEDSAAMLHGTVSANDRIRRQGSTYPNASIHHSARHDCDEPLDEYGTINHDIQKSEGLQWLAGCKACNVAQKEPIHHIVLKETTLLSTQIHIIQLFVSSSTRRQVELAPIRLNARSCRTKRWNCARYLGRNRSTTFQAIRPVHRRVRDDSAPCLRRSEAHRIGLPESTV
jgi:hypothetical protein